MRIAVFGAGGVGGYFGGRLAAAGEDVHFLARGRTLEALRQQGLHIESPLGDTALPSVKASDGAQEIGVVDLVLVGVKAWQVPEAAEQMHPLVAAGTSVLPLQNGVEAHEQLAKVLGADQVLDGLCKVISRVESPGRIVHFGAQPTIEFGEADGFLSPRVQRLAACFENAGIAAVVSEDIRVQVWSKFLFIGAVSALGAVTRVPLGVLRRLPETRRLLEQAMREVEAVGRAQGVNLPSDVVEKTLTFLDGLPEESTASMQRDIMEGYPSELEAQNGAVIRLGQEVNVPTPVNEFLYGTLLPQEMQARENSASS